LKAELAEIQVLNNHYFERVSHGVVETQAHVQRRARLEQIVNELVALKQKGNSSPYRNFR
jgi:hypothetical protein